MVVALAAVMVVPALSGIRSVGTAIPIALPSPPAVGGCAVRVFDATADLESTPPELSVSAVRFGSCRGLVAGEVVAFWTNKDELAGAPRSRRSGPCYLPLVQYAGLRTADSPPDPSSWANAEPVFWRPTIAYQAFLLTPSGLERRAGRDWSACVIAPVDGREYRGSLLGAYSAGTLPIGFGSCWTLDDSGLLAGPEDCRRPHSAQLLATGRNGNRYVGSSENIVASCSRAAGSVMGTDDPTRGGQLAVVADRMDRLTVTWSGNPSALGCFVTAAGGRQLTGLVIGLGDRPVPFVS